MMFKIIGPTYKINKKLLSLAAKEAFLYLGKDFEVNLLFVTPKRIQELNRIYRHKDKITDVLSFKLDDKESGGDIVVCLAQAKEDAKCSRLNLEQEVALLLVHGMLHLAGFEHTKAHNRAKMEKAEKEILSKVGIEVER